VKSKKELMEFYKKHIDIPLFRVVPYCDYKKIINGGINPEKNPYSKIIPDIRKLRRLVKRLEEKGFSISLNWGRKVSGLYALDTTLQDLSDNCIDFSPDKSSIKYYMKFEGGAATFNLKNILSQLKKFKLGKNDLKIVNKLGKFVNGRSCKNKFFYLKGSSKCFENSLFQKIKKKSIKKFKRKEYIESPFGSFENFEKVIKKYGMRKYLPYLKNKEYYVKVKGKIKKSEIFVKP